ncbi:MAG: hypothetical protein ABI324_06325 [Ktedonobacteraceae bacterium]
MPTDALLQLQASTTKTATFQGTALILAAGTPRRGLKARVIYSAANTSAGAGSVTFGLDVSYDAGSTWNTDFQANAIVLSTTAASGELFIPFEISPTSVANGCQIRLSVEAISGTGGTVTYVGDISLSRP